MKGKLLFLIFLAVAGQKLLCQERKVYNDGYYVTTGDMAPDFTVCDTDGKTYRLSDLRGKVVMLQFTASWCSVCRKEMPYIEKEIWQPKKSDGLIIIGVDRDEPVDKVLSFKKSIPVTYTMATDKGAGIFGLYAQKDAGVTRNVIIDRSGRIVFLTRLFKREEFDKMKKVIFELLAVK